MAFRFPTQRRNGVTEFIKLVRQNRKATRSLIPLLLIVFFSTVSAGQSMAQDPIEDLLAATFRITDGHHSGTGFLVAYRVPGDTSEKEQIFLVTAKHNFEDIPGTKCDLMLRCRTGEDEFSRLVTSINIREGTDRLWLQHPDVDVATLKIDLPSDAYAKPIVIDQIANDEMLKNRTVRVGQEAWVACYPAMLEANDAGWPVLRKGAIASFPLAPAKSTKTMLVDYSVFGGDSGAPVAAVVNNKLLLIGVACSMHRQTDRSNLPYEERVVHFPIGMSIVVHAEFLREVLDFHKKD